MTRKLKAIPQAKSLIERLKTAPRRKHGTSWIELLPEDTVSELLKIKELVKSGEIKLSKRHTAQMIEEEYGVDKLGATAETIRNWLSR